MIPLDNSWQNYLSNVWKTLVRDRLLYLIVLIGFLATYLMNRTLNPGYSINFFLYWDTILYATLNLFLIALVAYFLYLAANRHPRPLTAYKDKIKAVLAHPHEVTAFLLLLAAIIIFKSSFTALKSMIPSVQPFAYDIVFADLDRWLHFGIDPWKITHTLFAQPVATGLINLAYNSWFLVYWIVLMYFLVRQNPPGLRMRYLVTFMLSWFLIGNVLAAAMSSAGPCYYHLVTGGLDTFTPLMDHLRAQDLSLEEGGHWLGVWALRVQDMLWNYYITDTTGLGNGISAMPSMHVSVAVLMALGIQQVSRRWGYVFWGYALMIQIGSVHLAWHYAIDGYLSGFLTYILWKIVGRFYPVRSRSSET